MFLKTSILMSAAVMIHAATDAAQPKKQSRWFRWFGNSGSDHSEYEEEKVTDKMIGQAGNITFALLQANSETFLQKIGKGSFPCSENRISNFKHAEKEIESHARNVRPIVTEQFVGLLDDFLTAKQDCGPYSKSSAIEQQFYKDMTRLELMDRLLKKRPLMFVGADDVTFLNNGKSLKAKDQHFWEHVGKDSQDPSGILTLKDYMSYDEMSLAAQITISVPTFVINVGNRHNFGKREFPKGQEQQVIYVAQVGCRFEKPNLMEWKHMVVTNNQNRWNKGYNANVVTYPANRDPLLEAFENYYDEKFPRYDNSRQATALRLMTGGNNAEFAICKQSNGQPRMDTDSEFPGLPILFNLKVFKKRCQMSAGVLLQEANRSGKRLKKRAYAFTVGLGLGVWQLCNQQKEVFVEAFAEAIRNNELDHVDVLDVSWIYDPSNAKQLPLLRMIVQKCKWKKHRGCKDFSTWTAADKSGRKINVRFTMRNPFDELKGKDAGKLIVANYAWDGNSYPGNEYWVGNLNGSGDPAAACCSTIGQLQNPEINPAVSAEFTLVMATNPKSGSVEHIYLKDYDQWKQSFQGAERIGVAPPAVI